MNKRSENAAIRIMPGLRGVFVGGCLALLAGCQSGTGSSLESSSENANIVGTTDGDLTVVSVLPAPPVALEGRAAVLAANDLIEVDVFRVDDLDREARIDDRGFLSLPLIGEVQAAGLTAGELELAIERRYGQNYLQSPEVSVFVKESVGQRITLDGEFRRSGFQPVTSQTTLLQAVATAGGLNDIADPNEIFVFREYPDGKKVASYSIAKIRKGAAPDPRLFGGDVVVSFPSGARVAARNLREALGLATSIGSVAAPL
ncbi:MAG: polysaccharide biosynthesis/export family protein [Pseudomonadota bacterium]